MFKKVIIKITKALDKFNIPHMIIGGQAVLFYGEPRFTRDIDITLGLEINDLELFLKIISRLKFKPLTKNVQKFVSDTMVLPVSDISSGIRIDFIFSNSEFEKEAIKRVKKVKYNGTTIKIASLEDVVIHKMVAGRPRDIEDIVAILSKNPEFDSRYILSWLRKFDLMLEKNLTTHFKKIRPDYI
ncbi:MAG: nucleotidyl transferase AbiEii/AbiGii toxin family protein [Bacteroidota bacterium]|nr:nucleotidyl transferase AbiEii/AbiGii toxin family protein [Bacteroidota bacterium]